MGNRQVQMIAIGGAMRFILCRRLDCKWAGTGTGAGLSGYVAFFFFSFYALGELVLHRPSSGKRLSRP